MHVCDTVPCLHAALHSVLAQVLLRVHVTQAVLTKTGLLCVWTYAVVCCVSLFALAWARALDT